MKLEQYEIEKEGQIEFFKQFNVDYENDVLVDNTDGIWNGNILEFKLTMNNINSTLFQVIKYLSKMRIKGKNIPANILLISLNERICYYFKSKDYFNDIHKIYYGASSKNNETFISKDYLDKLIYSNMSDAIILKKLLQENNFMPIDIDENCIVGWAERYYRENKNAKKGDFLGDSEGQTKITGEIRDPKHFKGFINPYTKKTNERFKYLMDKLNDSLNKKELGAFYTPIEYTEKSAELLRKAIQNVPRGNDYVIIDRCAGTGNLESVLTDEELSHCILSTYEYYEFKVLMERLGDKVKFIIPPTEELVEYKMGFIANANALSKDYIENSDIKAIINDPKMTIIMYENPPYSDTSASGFINDKGEKKKTKRKDEFVTMEYKKEISELNENRGSNRDISNLFIWSAFKYYLRQPTDSYIIYSPVKYFKSVGLANKKFIDGYLFNRDHFHASESSIGCILWQNIDEDRSEINLKAFDIENGKLKYEKDILIKKVKDTFLKYFDKRNLSEDEKTNVWVEGDGKEISNGRKCDGSSIFNENIIGYLRPVGFPIAAMNRYLTRQILYNARGFYLRKDNYIEKLPLFCAKMYPQTNWYEKDVYFTTSDGGNNYLKDKELLKSCLIYTSLSQSNKIISFKGSDNRIYQNELCFDGNTIAFDSLKSFSLNNIDKVILDIFAKVLKEAKKTKNYDPTKKYGTYQIIQDLNTSSRNANKIIYDYPELNGHLETLKAKLKEYYLININMKMGKL